MNLNYWKFIEKDKNLIKNLKKKYSLLDLTAEVLAAKVPALKQQNMTVEEHFFCKEIELDYNLKESVKAAKIINLAIKENKKIAIFGDYDCDGICATAILYSYILKIGGNVLPYIPKRSEGYGLSYKAIDFFKEQNIYLIVTVDNGIVAFEEAEYIKKLGIKLIITDHHILGERLPVCEAIVNPKREDDDSDFKNICGAFVALKLVFALNGAFCEQILKKYAHLVAIATIGDVMPIIYENRFIVEYGLKNIYKNASVGLKNLLKLCGLDKKAVSSTDLAFFVCPKLNAPGRLEKASLSFKLLVCEDEIRAKKLARMVFDCNIERKKIEETMLKQAFEEVLKNEVADEDKDIIVVAKKDWKVGLIGILAAKLMRTYGKPCVVLAKDKNFWVGSARSFEGFSIYDALKYSSQYFVKWGGHSLAGGLTLKEEYFQFFKESIYRFSKNNRPFVSRFDVSAIVDPEKINFEILDDLNRLAPFGHENKEPIFLIQKVMLKKIVGVGNNKHLKLKFSHNSFEFEVIFFNVAFNSFYFKVGQFFNILVNLCVSDFLGEKKIEFKMVDIRPFGFNQDVVVEDYYSFIDILNKRVQPLNKDLPKREDYVYVYNIFRKIKIFYGNSYNLYLLLFKRLSYFKLLVILKVFITNSILKKGDKSILYNKIEGKIDLKYNEVIEKFK